MKFIITGGGGRLASYLRPLLEKNGHKVISADLLIKDGRRPNFYRLDVSNYKEVRRFFDRHRPEMALHLAAATDVDQCELKPDEAYRINALGTENIALSCRKAAIPMLYVSTAEVFDGKKKTPYTERDKPNPINIYGKSKLEGEKIVQKLLKQFYIVRTAWLIGGGKKDNKFVGKIMSLLKTSKQIKIVRDKIGSPTFAKDLAKNILKLIETRKYGLYHICNRGFCSRFQMAKKMVELLGLKKVKVVPVSSKNFKAPAPRGPSEALSNHKLDLIGLNLMPTWEEGLERYLKTEF